MIFGPISLKYSNFRFYSIRKRPWGVFFHKNTNTLSGKRVRAIFQQNTVILDLRASISGG